MIALCEMVEFYECASRLNLTGSSKLRARAWFFLGKMLKKVHMCVVCTYVPLCVFVSLSFFEL